MKLFKAFKSIFSQFKSFTKDDLNIVMAACQNGDLKKIDKLFKKKTLRINPLPIQSILSSASMYGRVDIMNYLLTSENTQQFQQPEVSLDRSLEWASINNQIDLIKYLLTLPNTIKNHISNNKENKVLDNLAQMLHFDSINFFINSALFKDKMDLHTNKDILFIQAYNNRKDEFLEYLIFDRKLEATKDITEFLNNPQLHKQNDPYLIHIKHMFEVRNLSQDLNNELKHNIGSERKKIKI
jgi:hypothetical protein